MYENTQQGPLLMETQVNRGANRPTDEVTATRTTPFSYLTL